MVVTVRAVFITISLGSLYGAAVAQEDPERARICTPGFSATQRLPRAEYEHVRDLAFAKAGVPLQLQCTRAEYAAPVASCYALDHIVPLELGGSWDLSNLQVQNHDSAKAKDGLENLVHRLYCKGEMPLGEAKSHFYRTAK